MAHHADPAATATRNLNPNVRQDVMEALDAQGYPPFLIQHLSSVAQDYQDGIFAGASNLIEVVTGTPAQSVEDFATANPAAFDRR